MPYIVSASGRSWRWADSADAAGPGESVSSTQPPIVEDATAPKLETRQLLNMLVTKNVLSERDVGR